MNNPNVKVGTVEKLVHEYPAHGFVIDQNEATELFEQVRSFDPGETRIFGFIENFLRIPDSNGIVSDLRTDFPAPVVTNEETSKMADQSRIGVEDAESDNDQRGNPEEHDAAGAGE